MSKRLDFAVLMVLTLILFTFATSLYGGEGSPQATAPETSTPQASPGDEFKIPENATPEKLVEFAKNLMQTKRQFEKEDDFKSWLNQMFQTVLEVANRILSGEADDKTFLDACGMKGQVLAHMAAGNKEYLGTFDQYVTALEGAERVQKDKQGREMTLAFRGIVYQDRVANIVQSKGTLDELRDVFKEIQVFILKNPEMGDMVFDLIYPISVYSDTTEKPELNGQLIQEFYDALKDSKDETHQQVAKGLEGSLRFANLKGKPFPIQGILTDGKPFDPASIAGKVVLVDFWATWCMPCLAIQPELLELYEKYRAKGFEIIGYNVDTDLETFKKFYAEKPLKWPVIVEKLVAKDGEQTLSEYYGITGIPTLVLIGRDGKVVSQDLDIDTLKEALVEQFKEP